MMLELPTVMFFIMNVFIINIFSLKCFQKTSVIYMILDYDTYFDMHILIYLIGIYNSSIEKAVWSQKSGNNMAGIHIRDCSRNSFSTKCQEIVCFGSNLETVLSFFRINSYKR